MLGERRSGLGGATFDLHRMLPGLGEMFHLRAEAKVLNLRFDLAQRSDNPPTANAL